METKHDSEEPTECTKADPAWDERHEFETWHYGTKREFDMCVHCGLKHYPNGGLDE